jgi:peptidoglycan/xylan/chitin deacetylase (PgdA/CDA1 family)
MTSWRRWVLIFIMAEFLTVRCSRPIRTAETDITPVATLSTTPQPPSATIGLTATETLTPAPTHTATSTLIPWSSNTPTVTPHGDVAPVLPHLPKVHFVYHGDRSKPYVALTFDVCQKPEYPAWFDRAIYEVLLRYDVPATFFMGGDWMRTHPDETLLLAQNPKFEMGNHSWSHPDLPDLSEAQISQEIVKTQDMLYKLTGRQARLFRLPSGLYNDLTLSVLAWHGLYTIQWDVETGDPDPTIDAARMNGAVRERVQNGSIIIMHANGRGWHTAEALPEMIEYLQNQGYTLVTVSQLLGLEPLTGQ